jgi:hypothetical protein
MECEPINPGLRLFGDIHCGPDPLDEVTHIIRNQLAALNGLEESVMEIPRHASAFCQSLIEQDPLDLSPRIALFGIRSQASIS